MDRRMFICGAAAAAGASALLPETAAAAKAYPVNLVHVEKRIRRLRLMHDDIVLRTYKIALGFSPVGPKRFQGDGKTPEGIYRITHRNPGSQFHLSLGVSYPNLQDIRYARSHGRSPGGLIMVHGIGRGLGRVESKKRADWTAGCIAVTDQEMEEIYRFVTPGTTIRIDA